MDFPKAMSFCLALTASSLFSILSAQEATTYYRLLSGKAYFEDCCIQDHTNNSQGADDYTIEKVDMDNERQLWTLIPVKDGSEEYYIRNKKSLRYISSTVQRVGIFDYTQNVFSKNEAAAWTMTDLGNGQVAFSCIDNNGITRFLNAAKTTATKADMIYGIANAPNSGFAWILLKEDVDPTSVNSAALGTVKPKVTLLGRQIVVTGCNEYHIVDTQGRLLPTDSNLEDGVYIVKTDDGTSCKILIK